MGGLLDGKVVLITGGGSGIGRSVARRFAAEGARVVSLDRTAPQIADDIDCLVGDVRDPEAHRRAVDHTLATYGRLDVLVPNAGVHDGGAGLDELTPAELVALARTILDVNVLGVLLAIQAASDALRASHGSVIVTVSDAAYTVVDNGAGPLYTTSKSALLGVIRSTGHALAPNVRVNGVAPGGVHTNLQSLSPDGTAHDVFDAEDDLRAEVTASNPLNTMLSADEVAASYLFLASHWSAGMTGEVLRPDCGLALR